MSGVFGNPWLYNPESPFFPFSVDQSLRFDNTDSAYLTRTPAVAGSRRTFTISFWHKKCETLGFLFAARNSSGGSFFAIKTSSDTLEINDSQNSDALQLVTTQVFRDVSAWYNLVIAIDTTQSTSTDRAKLYVNGVQVTSFSTSNYPNQNADMMVNSQIGHYIGSTVNASGANTLFIDAYLAEVTFIDGTALDASSFGQFKAGVWSPKPTSDLTFGVNGFYLRFKSTDINSTGSNRTDPYGSSTVQPNNTFADNSGRGNHLTFSGVAATDVVLDSPTNNFATMNPLDGNAPTIQEANLRVYGDTSFAVFEGFKGTFPMSSGKWYWEINAVDVNNLMQLGITPTKATGVGLTTNLSYHTDAMVYNNVGSKAIGTGGFGPSAATKTTTSYGASYTDGDIIGIALDLDSSPTTLTFYKNNSTQGTAFSSLASDEYVALFTGIENSSGIFNFGQDSSFAGTKSSGSAGASDANGVGDFFYTPPSGFLACSVLNLPSPAVDPANNQEPQDHFNIVLWTGNGSQTRSLTGVGFQPNWTWMKLRDGTIQDHQFYDAVRGAGGGRNLSSNTAVTEGTVNSYNDSDYGYLSSFDADGFSVNDGATSTVGGYVNYSGRNYVAWNWLAGGTTPSKTYKVVVVSDSGNKYRFRNSADSATFAQSAVELNLQEGGTYTFDQSDSTMSSHPMKLSTTSNGSHGGGSTYSTGVTYELDGSNVTESAFVSGFSSATSRKLIITVAASAPTLYYFCHYHSGMGGQINTNSTFGSTNFDGTILATVCENATTGISIIGWTGNAVDNTVIPHGLGADADVVITKRRSGNSDWLVLHSAIATDTANVLRLNATQQALNGSSSLTNGCPDEFTSVGFKVVRGTGSGMNNVNGSGSTYIAYAFKSKDGFSRFGSYTGSGSTSGTAGPYVHTGFRPAWVMLKKADGVGSWWILDSSRDPFNEAKRAFEAEDYALETGYSGNFLDFYANGFAVRTSGIQVNDSGNTYIYLAFAEQPFKFSNAR